MAYLKQAAVILLGLLGILLLALVIFGWGLATRSMTSYAERFWCWSAGYQEGCHFRGASTFLMWCIVGLVNMLIIGFLLEKITRK